jgi:DNA-binding winged helix-turn-helix (wHTH) protein
MSSPVQHLYEFDCFRLDPAERLLVREGAPVPLAPKAFEMLVVLVSNSGRLLTKDELMRALWSDVVVEENNLDKNISALRKALGERGTERKFIETVRGHGYRFTATVTELVAEQSERTLRQFAPDRHEPAIQASIPPLTDVPMTGRPALPLPVARHEKALALGTWRRKSLVGLAAVCLLAGALALHFWSAKEPPPTASPGISVARLTNGGYIHNAVVSPDGKYFAYTEQDTATARL